MAAHSTVELAPRQVACSLFNLHGPSVRRGGKVHGPCAPCSRERQFARARKCCTAGGGPTVDLEPVFSPPGMKAALLRCDGNGHRAILMKDTGEFDAGVVA